ESRSDTSLGEVVVGDVPDAVGEAAFASADPGVVGPVDTGFGFALIDVAAITPAETVPFEDARAELTLDLQKEAALDDVSSLAGEIDDARAGGATLEEIAQDMGLTLGTARSVALGGDGDGLAGEDVFQAEVFDAEESDERDLVEMEDGSYFVARVDSIAPASTLPLADVRDQVVVAWRTRKYEEALDAYAAASLERVDEGELLAVIADESNVEMESEGLKTRSDVWISLPVALVQELFAEPMGGAGVGAAPGLPGAVVIAQVVGIEAATPDEAALSQVSVQLNNLAGADALEVFLQAKQREAGVDINGQLIESLLSQTGGHGY
ncbi:MAG: peptidyl-prolyl cis-trans isomerase, partial [Pseudomonadota bacterium]